MPHAFDSRRLDPGGAEAGTSRMQLTIEFDREDDGRWIADIPGLPGVMAYGSTREDAVAAVQALAFRVLAEKVEHGEIRRELLDVSFGVAA